ncbi:MAG TPA: hypothetical protein VGR35_15570 [Tepidisphaeraceae bacterium]|nr:hypothetical protein [Tepidisphaeraceae bacterium]
MSAKVNDLPPGWIETPIDAVLAPLEDGRTLHHGWSPQCEKEPSSTDADWGVLKTTAIQDGQFLPEHNKKLPAKLKPRPNLQVRTGDLLITCAGPRSRCGIPCLVRSTRPRLMLSGKMYRFRVSEAVLDSRYMEAFLRSQATQAVIDTMKTGISDSGLNLTHGRFRRLVVRVAPLNEQRRIVAKIEELFSDLDAGVAALERVRANLKRYRAAVLKAAVEGRLTEAWRRQNPPAEPPAMLLARVLTARRKNWEADHFNKYAEAGTSPPEGWWEKYRDPPSPPNGSFPELPAGWCCATVEQCAWDVTVGHVGPMKERYIESGVPFLRSQNVRPLRFDRHGLKFIPEDFHAALSKSRLVGGELLVVRSGSVGEACVYPADAGEANCSDLVITRLLALIDPRYVALFVTSPVGRASILGRQTGSALAHFNVGAMERSAIPVPPVSEQQEIIAEVARRLSVVEAVEAEVEHDLKRAGRLRQAILKRAFEGKLVPQDPTDEPAAAILTRSRHLHDAGAASQTRSRSRRRALPLQQVPLLDEAQR